MNTLSQSTFHVETLIIWSLKPTEGFLSVGNDISLDSDTVVEITIGEVQIVFSRKQEPQINTHWTAPLDVASLKIELQHELLIALLNGPRWAHWNNAEIGSHLRFRRQNVEFERDLGHALYFFHI